MRDAIEPNLVQTLEHQPVLLHAGPFGNIAHANNSIIEDRIALKLGDYVITEAGFGSDLGFQKFCDIVCRFGGFAPSAGVLVTTVRATKSHGGMAFDDLGTEDLDALRAGSTTWPRTCGILAASTGCRASCRSTTSRPTPRPRSTLIRELAVGAGRRDGRREPRVRRGRAGRRGAGRGRGRGVRAPERVPPAHPRRHAPARSRSRRSRRELYGADGVDYLPQADKDLARMDELGFGTVPGLHGQDAPVAQPRPAPAEPPTGFRLPVRGVVPSAGAGFVVVLCGDMQRMPGLGATPNFMGVDIDAEGRTVGLF